jgi:hypothetical protein
MKEEEYWMEELRNKFHLPPFEYFGFGNIYSGSLGAFNYKIWPKEELRIVVWYGKYCCEKSQPHAEKTFSSDEKGLGELCQWLENEYQEFVKE